jgi:hypothetical protein
MPPEKKLDLIEQLKKQLQEEERKKLFTNINYSNIKPELKQEMIRRAAEQVANNPYLKKKTDDAAKKPLPTHILREVDSRRSKR